MNNRFGLKQRNFILLFIFLCIIVYFFGWGIPLMEIDAVQYANISREMLYNKSFVQLFDRGKDYLDKPPMLFWLSSLSMYLFGINDAAYRLPSLLFAILAIYSTYRLALIFYSDQIALLSALVLASCQAMFLITHDVRTDTMLMGWVIFSIWQLAEWFQKEKWKYLVCAAIGIAGGLMTKGPIALMVPVFSFVPHFLLRRSFRQFFRWQYLVMILIIGILLTPMCIGLYRQYDLHPEKIMYGQKGTSGLRFFFWTQSFGRITGESTWHENDSFFFLFQNMLWGFLPWIIFFIAGLIADFVQLVRKKFFINEQEEWISDGGFIITYCALAISRAQLPHYIYVVFPLAAIMTGKCLYKFFYSDSFNRFKKPLFIFHTIIFSLLFIALFVLLYFPFPPQKILLLVLLLVMPYLVILAMINKWIPLPSLLILSVFTILLINAFLDTGFYPALLQFQMGVKASSVIAEKHLDKNRFFIYKLDRERSLEFYSNHSFRQITNTDSLNHLDYLLTSKGGFDTLKKDEYIIIYEGEGFHVSTLTLPFLNPAKRKQEATPYFILQRL